MLWVLSSKGYMIQYKHKRELNILFLEIGKLLQSYQTNNILKRNTKHYLKFESLPNVY